MDIDGYGVYMATREELSCIIQHTSPDSLEYSLAQNLIVAYHSIEMLQTTNENMKASLAGKFLWPLNG